MPIVSRLAGILGLAMLAACASAPSAPPASGIAGGWTIADSSVRFGPEIERTASGTDYNSTFVWDGYNGGNRKRQVVGLFRSAISDVSAGMPGSREVTMNVVVRRFHALTPDMQTWCCGEHNIVADLEVVDPGSGEVLASGQGIYLGRTALGGIPGLVATAAGRDQVVRVREGIAKGISRWLAGL